MKGDTNSCGFLYLRDSDCKSPICKCLNRSSDEDDVQEPVKECVQLNRHDGQPCRALHAWLVKPL
jgi:hypothetical protein